MTTLPVIEIQFDQIGLIQATFHKSRSANGGKVRGWHFSAVPTALSNVGYLGWTGRHMLKASSSHFDHTRHGRSHHKRFGVG